MTNPHSRPRTPVRRSTDNDIGDIFALIQKEFAPILNHTVGFENTFGDLLNLREMGIPTFPPHNIRKRENRYYIDLAVAGMAREDLEITLEDGLLTVAGKTGSVPEDAGMEYVYKGIAERAFSKSWRLGEHTKVLGADLVDGTLTVELEQVVPEGERLRTIEIK